MSNTRDRMLEKYNTYRRRPTIADPETRKMKYKSYQRTLGPWLPVSKEKAILDIACGEGALLSFLKELGYHNLSGFDYSPENVQICHHLGLDFVQQHDALKIDEIYPAESFDMVFIIAFLEHIPKERAVDFLEQVAQKIKPDGEIVLQTPNLGSILGLYPFYNDLTHEFGITEKSAVDLMLMAGFKLENIEIKPVWTAITPQGYVREVYWKLLHSLIYLGAGSSRPKIPTPNILFRGIKG